MGCNCKKNVNIKTDVKKKLIDNIQNKQFSVKSNLSKQKKLSVLVGTKIIY